MTRFFRSKRFKQTLIIVFVLAVAAGVIITLHNRSVNKAQKVSGTVPNSKKAGSGTHKTESKSNNEKTSTNKAQGVAVTDSATLVTPFGTFISNHRPGQNGAPTSEQSVCNTTPGATCNIVFTNGGVTKDLGAQVANGSGTAYWSWDIRGGTLAPGTWKVTAVVKLNGQTKTASDPTPLEVR